MSMDGSFSLKSAVERFLARCPELQPQLNHLLNQEDLKDDAVVNSVAHLFLHQSYSIPLIGCFRPIADRIVNKAVVLLRMVPNLNSDSDVDHMEEEEGDQLLDSVVDFHHRRGKGLTLHELACLALCRALDLAPFLKCCLLTYFEFAPPPFQRVVLMKGEVSDYLLPVRTAYRLLVMEPEVFSKLWDWSCFVHFVSVIDLAELKWYGNQILFLALKSSNKEDDSIGDEEAYSYYLKWKEFCQDVAMEKLAEFIEPCEEKNSMDIVSGEIALNQEDNLLKFLGVEFANSLQIHGIEPPLKKQKLTFGHPSFVMTPVLKKSFKMVGLAVKQKWPVLLYGPPGAGKTALIEKLARESGNQVISIHMDDQLDGKTLVGNYVCTELPGEFRWQPGTLSQAIQKGMWVVFEDIDKAPSDVHSILLPLLEGAASFATTHGEDIRVPGSFRIFATTTTSHEFTCNAEGGHSLGVLWRRVMIRSPNRDDMQSIIKAWYPDLEPLAENLIETFERVNSIFSEQFLGHHYRMSASSVSLGRFTLRDLLKWCKRIKGLGEICMSNGLSAYHRDRIFWEAVDIFAASFMPAEKRLTIVKDIAKLWTILISEEEVLYPPNKPVIQDLKSELRIGRGTNPRHETAFQERSGKSFVEIRSSLHVLERIACSVRYNEPVLLVGETGTGKTTLVQNLASRLGQKLTVLNLSQQSDVADLLGGFKPIDAQSVCGPLYREFEDLFSRTKYVKPENKADVLGYLHRQFLNKNWKKLLTGFKKCAADLFQKMELKGKQMDDKILQRWEHFSVKLDAALRQIDASMGMIFSFVEGAFVAALRRGEWILLDEVNLAPPETLQRIIGVLEGEYGSICLAERGDVTHMPRHPNFRIFACMNPANDSGKRDLPYALRSRFTEYFVDDVLDDEDLQLFIEMFMNECESDSDLKENIKCFYKEAKKLSGEKLQDGANQKPQYSLRSLYRALDYTAKAKKKFGFRKALFDGFCMFFVTLLDIPSAKIMLKMILKMLFQGKTPQQASFDAYLSIKESSKSDDFVKSYVLTTSVGDHLSNLARAILIKRYPVLLQGPTSSGKTSLVRYLAAVTGHEFVRINNHEHTDLQEYLGSYVTDSQGKLVFQEGVLVKAVRKGYWIVLDELNLAPSDVLEALNRLLDDNRELFVPELCETIPAHENFMLFATQNPPNSYGGRKVLSRAFRNRFVELHVDEIPDAELTEILEKKCQIPKSYKMVDIMKDLQLHRQSSRAFAGKHGFITPRDLFRWANRFRVFGTSHMDLARDGYYLLAERLRDEDEKLIVVETLKKHLRVEAWKKHLCVEDIKADLYTQDSCLDEMVSEKNSLNVILTTSMKRLYFLVKRCYELREPVLLVGETGGGKTTVCQLLAEKLSSKLHTLNCHQYTETSDFVGGFYPIRDRSKLMSEFKKLVEKLKQSIFSKFHGQVKISSDIGQAASTIDQLALVVQSYRQGLNSSFGISARDIEAIEEIQPNLLQLHRDWEAVFKWRDGPLVQAMRMGDLFLIDEISLAEDSVLERLNSVLEPERKLSLAEKGGTVLETIAAHENFFVLATMNPGGDYGKKELSPALRNRFTEIWVPSANAIDELRRIALDRISCSERSSVEPMLKFWDWYQSETGRMLTVRDLLSWISFINVMHGSLGSHDALLHGVFLFLLDGLSLGTGISKEYASKLRERCFCFLLKQLKVNMESMERYGWISCETKTHIHGNTKVVGDSFGIDPFYIEKGSEICEVGGFEFSAPTTCRNALRVLRAMQLPKPVLLEGSPGVGKTSLVAALGKFSGHRVVRINLSEQTDMMDLLGSDLPVESDDGMKFAWSDGILLQALKQGHWVLLDELNLAPQSVLEGLNAILDHRAKVFIPELGKAFDCPSSFRVFACQNPCSQGSGRKGLPRSFLNRFTKVYVDELVKDDYHCICRSLYPSIPKHVLEKLIDFNKRMHEDTMIDHKFAQDGSPWEFNLRDVIRSCQIITCAPEKLKFDYFVNIVYIQRMRTASDRVQVLRIYEEVFGMKPDIAPYPRVQVNSQYLMAGNTIVKKNHSLSVTASNIGLNVVPGIRQSLEAVAHCIQHKWLCILVGPVSSGKTSLIRLLARLTGNRLNELNLSSATDISELLGCFEQYNAFRNFRLIVSQVDSYINEYISLSSGFSMKEDLVTRWLAFVSTVDRSALSCSSSKSVENLKHIVNSLGLLKDTINTLKLAPEQISVSWTREDLNNINEAISKLQDNHEKLFSSKFEWVTGPLIKAIENGEWVVLKNANLCNPTVLDRINSLVEHCGSITVNERGIVDGKELLLYPHPNFRIFLTVNPVHGEVSRAMRNRGVEIFMMEPHWLLDEGSGSSLMEIELRDVERFLVLSGVPIADFVASMAKAHLYARDKSLQHNVRVTYFELGQWVQLFQQLLKNGNRPTWSLQTSWEHTYLSSLGEAVGANIVSYALTTYLSRNQLLEPTLSFECVLHLSGSWPMPFKLSDIISFPNEASVTQTCMVLEYIGAQWASYELEKSGNPILGRHSTSQGNEGAYINYMNLLGDIVFPKTPNRMIFFPGSTIKFDFKLVSKMLLFAANWTIEQTSEKDIQLYLLRIEWFTSQLHPLCKILCSFVTSMKEVLKTPIWEAIALLRQVDSDPTSEHLQPVPLPSLEGVSKGYFNGTPGKRELSCHAIKSARLLRLTYQQWKSEEDHHYTGDTKCFKQLLPYLRQLERKVLEKLVELPPSDLLIQLYGNLLEDHTFLWDAIRSSKSEQLVICWHSLKKNVSKLQDFCSEQVKNVLSVDATLDKVFQCSEKSMLWIHGGHPYMPASADLHDKQQQLVQLCEVIWPMKGNQHWLELVVSLNPILRKLALEGLGMSSSMMEHDHCCARVQDLDDIHQTLLTRYESEKHSLKAGLGLKNHLEIDTKAAACCGFFPEIMPLESGSAIWVDVLSIADSASFSLDLELLEKLSSVILGDYEVLQQGLSEVSNFLESALEYSITRSARPIQIFKPHQIIDWIVKARMPVEAMTTKIKSYILEMWFRWHSSLWNHCPIFAKNFSMIEVDSPDIGQPYMLVQPVKTSSVMHMLESTLSIKDYSVRSMKIRVASCNLWKIPSSVVNLNSVILSAARSLFQQIIIAHKRTFGADDFAEIKNYFYRFQKNVVTIDNICAFCKLIQSSSHKRLKSLMHSIEQLLKLLYLEYSSAEFSASLGHAWFLIGKLRFDLLVFHEDMDPTLKYTYKYTQLEEKILLLELENKVRQECEYLAGGAAFMESDDKRIDALQKLEAERTRLQRKIVYRPDPNKFSSLKKIFPEFKSVLKTVHVISGNDDMKWQEEVSSWHKTASCFIDQLAYEYADYIDVTQPVQMAVYEMKFGLSMVVAAVTERKVLNGIEEDKRDHVLDSIYSFMKFPTGCPIKSTFLSFERRLQDISSLDIDCSTALCALNMTLLAKLATSSQLNDREGFSVLRRKASLYHSILVRVTYFVANARLLDRTSFILLEKLFRDFASIWMDLKDEGRTKADLDRQQYKFKARAFKIESVLDIDMSKLGKLLTDDSFSEWKDLLCEEEDSTENFENCEQHDNNEEEWKLMQESILKDIVCKHNQVFGSTNLVLPSGTFEISDSERLCSFINSYTLGVNMIKVLEGALPFSLDNKLVPEHLFRLCLDQEFLSSPKSVPKYNFYTHLNAPVMLKMVEPLGNLQKQTLKLLSEWEEHPGLQKILNVIEMLLAIPVDTPLAKALSGLQFLLNRIAALAQSGSKFSLSVELTPIINLVCSWQKMEFYSWPALLDEVQAQYETEAGMLWFPLFSVLDSTTSDQLVIQSVQEFIETSSIGEFRKRLQLIFAFYGQTSSGKSLGVYSNTWQEKKQDILYNIFGYYVQFLPAVLEHIQTSRRNIEAELEDLLKLCRWERVDSLLSIENSKRIRLKLRKLIHKYSDLLQQPVLIIINKEAAQREVKVQLQDDKNLVLLDAVLNQKQFSDEDKCTWYGDWRKKLSDSLITLDAAGASETGWFDAEQVRKIINLQSESEPVCLPQQEEWKCVWEKLKMLCQFTKGWDGLWKNATNSVGKTRALSGLLKLLESSGLQRHAFENLETSKPLKWHFLEPSYDARHLLLAPSRLSNLASFCASECPDLFDEKLNYEWKLSNEYYFKSILSVKLLEQASLKPHEDLTLDQISRSRSYLNNLIVIQQTQRAEAYGFAKQLMQLQGYVCVLESFYSDCTNVCARENSEGLTAQKRHTVFEYMWQQKELLDDLYSLLCEESLLLRTLEDSHSKVCNSVKAQAKKVLVLFEKHIPDVKRSKESLDECLLGHDVAIVTVNASSQHYVISSKMQLLLLRNFQVIKNFEEDVVKQDISGSSTVEALLSHFNDAFVKAKKMFEKLNLDLKVSRKSVKSAVGFSGALKGTVENVMGLFQKVCSSNKCLNLSTESSGDITSWETLVKSCVADLNLDKLCDNLLEMANSFCSESICNSWHIPAIKSLLMFLDVILTIANGFLQNLLAVHKTVSILTHELASILASLFTNGFGLSPKDQLNDSSNDVSQDGCGTGIGEGVGIKDISDQIEDEDQLLGASDVAGTEQDASAEVPNNNEKGIEMEEDFLADAASVSQDSEHDDDDNEDSVEQLDSAMGEAGADSEVVDEKICNKDEDDNPNDTSEKNESGPSAKGGEERELRAKEENASTVDEFGDPAGNELDNRDDCTENEDVSGDAEENADMSSMDREEAFTDSTGLQLDEADQNPDEDVNMDEEETETDFQDDTEEHGEPTENGSEKDENLNPPADETMEEADAELGETSEKKEPSRDYQQGSDLNLLEKLPGISGFSGGGNEESVTEPQGGSEPSYSASTAPEADLSRRSDIYSEFAPQSSSLSGVDSLITGSSIGGRVTDDQPKTDLPEQEASAQKPKLNPFRNVGDALEDWKRRVKVSIDLEAEKIEEQDEMEVMDASEYGYVDRHEKGTAQTLGPATAEHTALDANDNDPDDDSPVAHKDEMTDMDIDIQKQQLEEKPVKHSSSLLNNKVNEPTQMRDGEKFLEQGSHHHEDGDTGNFLDMVSVKRVCSAEDNPPLCESHLEISQALEDVSIDEREDASHFWRRGELLRLSHELTEQLRLIMEPTIASKLQGDYKTGKRINMRKVIPYIASHYRKDKIWLRRTRPNKRDYQVVIAVDDSLSMSENGCGQVAIEALATVCRAMSQLELGNIAVVSFGKKGNIKLLHEFDQPFTVEAGIKMVSNLTFQQDNTASGDPVVDLLKYLRNMLDIGVARARSPSGENPLQQLVLIIGDGRFMEKNLKTYVRDASSWKRMIAYLILDNSKESIMNHLEAVPQPNGNLEFIKYLDFFPFPYYIVLRNIESLPRTLANLLRQWFEIMQYSRD